MDQACAEGDQRLLWIFCKACRRRWRRCLLEMKRKEIASLNLVFEYQLERNAMEAKELPFARVHEDGSEADPDVSRTTGGEQKP
jgi:hypothetical protein